MQANVTVSMLKTNINPLQVLLSGVNVQLLSVLRLFGIAAPRSFDAAESKDPEQTSIIIRSVNISIQLLLLEVTP